MKFGPLTVYARRFADLPEMCRWMMQPHPSIEKEP